MTLPAIGDDSAVFLDIDGTLIDIAPTPDAVVIPPDLGAILHRLRTRLGGAVAVISGRKLADIDRLVGADFAAAAEHGVIIRDAAGAVTQTATRLAEYDVWRARLKQYAGSRPGILIEEKAFSLVAHYRQAPEYEAELSRFVERLVGASEDATLLLAHCAFELKPRGGNKGDALTSFMAQPPFVGRTPFFVGDDVTDEPAIRAAIDLRGSGLHVNRDFGGSTQKVRSWLRGE